MKLNCSQGLASPVSEVAKPGEGQEKKFQYSREVPYDVNIEDLLTELLEYMEDRQDVEDGDYGDPKPNKEMRLATDIHQALYQLERKQPLYTGREVKEIAITYVQHVWETDGNNSEENFDKWWEVSDLNKSKSGRI